MKNHHKAVALFAVFVTVGGGVWLYGRYKSIKADVIQKMKEDTASYIKNRAAALLKPEAFTDKNVITRNQTFKSFFDAIQSPELVRIKVWDRNFTVIWSNLNELIGQRFPDNHEVQEAYEGKIEFEIDIPKFEHISERQFRELAEIYIPIQDDKGELVGVIEVYRPAFPVDEEAKSRFQKVAFPAILMTLAGYLAIAFLPRLIAMRIPEAK